MALEEQIINQASKASGISEEDLNIFFAEGEKTSYQANEWLFHESTPRDWAGIVLEGDVELVRGLHGSSRHVGSLIAGTRESIRSLSEAAEASSPFNRKRAMKMLEIKRI